MDTMFHEGVAGWKGKPAYAIYRFEGDKLHVATILDRDVRPVKFACPTGPYAQYGVFQRVDPKTILNRETVSKIEEEIQNEVGALEKTKAKNHASNPREEKIRLPDAQTVILPPLQNGKAPPSCKTPPDEKEIRKALPVGLQSIPFLWEVSRDNVRIVKELLEDKIDPKRFFPLVGPAQLHQCHWKITVTFDETIESSYPWSPCGQVDPASRSCTLTRITCTCVREQRSAVVIGFAPGSEQRS